MKRMINLLLSCIIVFSLLVPAVNVGASAEGNLKLVFNAVYYAEKYPDISATVGTDSKLLLQHFINTGMKEGKQGCEDFDPFVYKERYPELAAKYGNNMTKYYLHYIKEGYAMGLSGRTDGAVPQKNVSTATATKSDVLAFYDKSVFIGDSIMEGYRNYALTDSKSICNKSDFLTIRSYSLVHARADVSTDNFQPSYKGQKNNLWINIQNMDVDKVFLLFGTNDLSVFTPDQVATNTIELIKTIRQYNPDVEIYVLSMTPVYKNVSNGYLNKKGINELNGYLKDNQYLNMYTYVELGEYLKNKDGDQRVTLSSDKYVHYKKYAYSKVWEKVLYDFAVSEMAQ